jgi:methylglyoxal synthase
LFFLTPLFFPMASIFIFKWTKLSRYDHDIDVLFLYTCNRWKMPFAGNEQKITLLMTWRLTRTWLNFSWMLLDKNFNKKFIAYRKTQKIENR